MVVDLFFRVLLSILGYYQEPSFIYFPVLRVYQMDTSKWNSTKFTIRVSSWLLNDTKWRLVLYYKKHLNLKSQDCDIGMCTKKIVGLDLIPEGLWEVFS